MAIPMRSWLIPKVHTNPQWRSGNVFSPQRSDLIGLDTVRNQDLSIHRHWSCSDIAKMNVSCINVSTSCWPFDTAHVCFFEQKMIHSGNRINQSCRDRCAFNFQRLHHRPFPSRSTRGHGATCRVAMWVKICWIFHVHPFQLRLSKT